MTSLASNLEYYGVGHPDDHTWILHYSYPTNPLPMNGPKANWRGRARWTRTIKDQTYALVRAAHIPEMQKCEAQLVWWVATNHRRDVDNLAGLEKPMFDGLVFAHVVPDDTPEFMVKPRGEIRQVADSAGLVTRPGFTLTIRRLIPLEEF